MTNQEKLAAYKVEIAPLSPADGGGYQALYPQLARTTVGYGETPGQALADLVSGIDTLIASLTETGDTLPDPFHSPEWEEFSGRVTLRLSKSLHWRLEKQSQKEGVSLNSLLNDILQSGATALEAGLPFGAQLPSTVRDGEPASKAPMYVSESSRPRRKAELPLKSEPKR